MTKGLKEYHRKRIRHKRAIVAPFLCVLMEIVIWVFALKVRTLTIEEALIWFGKKCPQMAAGYGQGMLGRMGTLIRLLLKSIAVYPREICGTLITFGAITASIVVLFYSLYDAKNFGIAHRTIMSYWIGSCTLPLSFFALFCKLPVLYIAACSEMPVFVCVMFVYILLQQLFILFMIMLSTSCNFSIYVIAKEEKWQYKYHKELTREAAADFAAWNTSHAVCAMQSEDVFFERMRLITRILDVPLKDYKKRYKKEYKESINQPKWMCGDLYQYYYERLFGVFGVLKERDTERADFYQVLYGFMRGMRKDKKLSHMQKTPGFSNLYGDLKNVFFLYFGIFI